MASASSGSLSSREICCHQMHGGVRGWGLPLGTLPPPHLSSITSGKGRHAEGLRSLGPHSGNRGALNPGASGERWQCNWPVHWGRDHSSRARSHTPSLSYPGLMCPQLSTLTSGAGGTRHAAPSPGTPHLRRLSHLQGGPRWLFVPWLPGGSALSWSAHGRAGWVGTSALRGVWASPAGP